MGSVEGERIGKVGVVPSDSKGSNDGRVSHNLRRSDFSWEIDNHDQVAALRMTIRMEIACEDLLREKEWKVRGRVVLQIEQDTLILRVLFAASYSGGIDLKVSSSGRPVLFL